MEFAIVFDKEEEKLRRELSMLLSTRAGSVPVIRDYGETTVKISCRRRESSE